ncbi:MAG TPA: 2-phosphosulfolactate phosphatase [Anaerolineales bacterium]|jgi:2-phosphosulfolactate phosphatase|nr:2-phosphosulfolactate phosphatase [Anaerolineae bacterium]HRJ57364.1 2-phosphosulfolactate phosphatase [Anaerolineales bacterium]HRK89015.1 2-phosphosulfolactate phosphatase [Anaerolineales bacterium]
MSTNFKRFTLETCHEATGIVLIIDVLRAFSTAAYAFSRGAKEIRLVSGIQEALDLKAQIPNAKVMGEVGGLPPEGFDFGNSPTRILEHDLTGITLIQRTGAGTQGAVRAVRADVMLATSLVVAGATVRCVSKLDPAEVSFVITGGMNNDEDVVCAEYLEKQFTGQEMDANEIARRVIASRDALQHMPDHPQFPKLDLTLCSRIDAFDFAMPIRRENGHLIMRMKKEADDV